MRIFLIAVVMLVLVAASGTGLVLALDSPQAPPPMISVEHAFDRVDFSDMPPPTHFAARDGTKLFYRHYPGGSNETVVLVHGSSGTSASMHVLARAIHARGPTVYALAVRGHDGTGRYGDIDYVGQLDDDIADFLAALPEHRQGERRTLLGFSSGGGFVLRFAAGKYGDVFDRYILVSPQMPPRSPLMRPNAGGWVSVAIPRIIVLTTLSRFGIHAFEGLPVIAFAVRPEDRKVQTAFYSFRMLSNFGPNPDYLGDLKRVAKPIVLVAGAKDEIFYSDQYGKVLKPVRPDLDLTLVPGMGHMDMTTNPRAIEVVADKIVAR